MTTQKYAGADLYVDSADPARVVAALRKRWGVEPSFGSFTLPGFSVDVSKHRAYSRDVAPEHFLGWRTLIGIDADSDTSDAAMVNFVADLILYLAAAGFRSAAACRFEDELALLTEP
jgi:hypothetical protein